VLIDSRHNPQTIDLEFMEWLGLSQIPFSIVFTKTDKLKPEELEVNMNNYKEKMLESWELVPPFFVSSAEKGIGKKEILQYIRKINISNQKM
jgi:GTP-binding protein